MAYRILSTGLAALSMHEFGFNAQKHLVLSPTIIHTEMIQVKFLHQHLYLEYTYIQLILHRQTYSALILRRSEKKLVMTNVHWVWRGEDVGFLASINPRPTNQPTNPPTQLASYHQAKLLINTPI